MLNKLIYSQKGETIVEILVCLAVLGSVIGLSFGTSNRNLQAMRNSQERAEALKLAEGQIEKIAAQPSPYIGRGDGTFCIKVSDGTVQGTPCTSGIFTYYVQKSGLNFNSIVNWDRLGGGPQQNINIIYEALNQ